MSAIAGILSRNGDRDGGDNVKLMLDSLKHRYHESGTGFMGPIAMGYGSFPSTREEMAVTKPFRKNNMLLVCDGRLDNREELGRTFGWDVEERRCVSDHEIIMAAYVKWGIHCLSRLIGVFSFALWDGAQLFCARDRFGVKPFTYSLSDRVFVFASEAKAVLSLPEVKDEIREEQICLHFYPQLLTYGQEETYYDDIYRLPPAHGMVITDTRADVFRYWELNPEKKTVYKDEKEYYDCFRELLSRAVSDRMRSLRPVGTALSGGLDSSAVTCLARDISVEQGMGPLNTFSCVFPKAVGSDESEWILSVEEQGELAPCHVFPDSASPMEDIEDLIRLHEGPFYGANSYLQRSMYIAAREKNVNVFLDGEDGDSVVSHGYDFLSQLARCADWNAFFNEADGIVQHFDDPQVFFSRSYLFRRYGLPRLWQLQKSRRWFSLIRNINLIHDKLDISRKAFVKALLAESGINVIPYTVDEPISREMWDKYRIGERLRELSAPPTENQLVQRNWHHFDGIVNSGYAYSLEFADRLAAWYGMEVRHPFFDHRLVEYCLSLPASIKLRDGYTRFYFREAMKGVLPDKVRTRGGKGDLTHSAVRGYRLFHEKELIMNSMQIPLDDPLVNRNKLEDVIKEYTEREDDSQTLPLWNYSTYGLWRRNRK